MRKLTRREFLTRTGSAAATAYPTMMALGLLPAAPAYPFHLEGDGQGKKVLILGAGLAGMAAAYELGKSGYRCTILEARERAGGRCWSVRRGSTNTETGQPLQTAHFDEGQYFNAGPSRIPHHHELTLHYCKELGVPIQVYNNVNESAWYFSEGKGPLSNKKIRMREVHNDLRGWIAELLAKGLDGGKIDARMNGKTHKSSSNTCVRKEDWISTNYTRHRRDAAIWSHRGQGRRRAALQTRIRWRTCWHRD